MSGGVRAATQQVEDALLQEYDQIAGGVSNNRCGTRGIAANMWAKMGLAIHHEHH